MITDKQAIDKIVQQEYISVCSTCNKVKEPESKKWVYIPNKDYIRYYNDLKVSHGVCDNEDCLKQWV